MNARIAERLYRTGLQLLPRRQRADFGEEAAQLFAWQLARVRGAGARVRFVLGSLADVVGEAVAARQPKRPRPAKPRGVRMQTVLHDLRIAFRNLIRQPSVTLPIVITLGLGIGLATAMVGVVQEVLLRPLPYPASERLLTVRERTEAGALVPASVLNFADWRERAASFEALAAVVGPRNTTVQGAHDPVRVPAVFVSTDYFRVAGVTPALGRVFDAEENRPGGPPAVVVSHGFWTRTLSGQRDLTDARLTMQDLLGRSETYSVVGVMPPGFELMGEADVYVPLDRGIPWNVRGNHVVDVIGRLRADAARATAAVELDAIQARIHENFSGETEAVGVGVSALHEEVVGPVRTPVLLLLVGALLLLASAFVDATGALLARGVARQHELLVRVSLGATRGRLLGQLVLESGLYAVGGLLVGLAVASGLLRVLARVAPAEIPRLAQLQPEWLGLAAVAAVLAAGGMLFFGLVTAVITTRRGGAALRVRGGHTGRGTRTMWNVLIAAEVALALMLMTTAGVLGRSLWGILSEDTGFDGSGVITAEVNLPSAGRTEATFVNYFDRALEELRALGGVEAVGLGNMLPVGGVGGGIGGPVQLETGDQPDLFAQYRVADDGFFAALRIRLVRGRVFDETDAPGAPHAAVVNTTMAERLWPGEDPLGKRFYLGGMDPYREDWLTVIGVVEEARPWSTAAGTFPVYYVHYRQRPAFLAFAGADFVVRGRDAARLAEGMRARLAGLATDAPVRVQTLAERMAGRTADRRFVLSLLATFAALALVLTAVGIWGVVSFIASRRTRELGIRLALGARPGQVLRGLQREAIPAVAMGILIGGVLAGTLTRLVRSHLYGVGVFDPVSLAAVAITLAATAWCASYIPARRVKRLDPAVTLRNP